MCEYFIPSLSFWLNWLTDSFINQDYHEISEVFELAIKFCPDQSLIEEYLEYMFSKYENDELV